jgi:ABC-2 type transport system ATP-binding protein
MVGLDPHHARVVKDILKERSEQGMTVFLSTHQLSVAEQIADRIGIINLGKFVAIGTLDELRQRSGSDGLLEDSFLAITREAANLTEQRAPEAVNE